MTAPRQFRLTLACPDRLGIAAAVAQCIVDHGGWVQEAHNHAETDDPHFFMRVAIEHASLAPRLDDFQRAFEALAARFAMRWSLADSARPKRIVLVSDLPRTRNQKIMRRVVRSLATQQAAGDLTSLSNPEIIDELRLALAAQPAAAPQ